MGSPHPYDPAPTITFDPGGAKYIQSERGPGDCVTRADCNYGFVNVEQFVYDDTAGKDGDRRKARHNGVRRAAKEAENGLRGFSFKGLFTLAALKDKLEAFATHMPVLTNELNYGSRTFRAIRSTHKQNRKRLLDRVVQPDPNTVVFWGANFNGQRSLKGDRHGPSLTRALRRRFALTRRVVLVNEYLTSKTCCVCGARGEANLAREFVCDRCGTVTDRDWGAARNIDKVWRQYFYDGQRPAGLEIPEGSPWADMQYVCRRADWWSTAPANAL